MKKIWLLLGLWTWTALGLWELVKMPGVFAFHALDIGQGDAIVITTPEENRILVDGGPGQTVLEELGKILPLLWNEIDLVVLTHPHADHVEGLVPVLQRFDVGAVLLTGVDYPNLAYEALLEELQVKEIPYYVAEAGRDFQLGSVVLDVLYPFQSEAGAEFENVNNSSVVMKVSDGKTRILLMGDAELEEEEALLTAQESNGQVLDLEADILKVGHHGSRTSSSWELLEAVEAEVMVVSAGRDSQFGHPHPETVEKAEDLDVPLLRTTDGRVSLRLSESDLKLFGFERLNCVIFHLVFHSRDQCN